MSGQSIQGQLDAAQRGYERAINTNNAIDLLRLLLEAYEVARGSLIHAMPEMLWESHFDALWRESSLYRVRIEELRP